MGVKLKDLADIKEITFDQLEHKILAVDAYNYIYQFLTTIRQPDGTPLQDSQGNVTSHLTGLFSRTTKLMQKGIKPVFVFDGKPPKLKEQVGKERTERKRQAREQYELAREEGDIEQMRKYAGRTAILTKEMVEESKQLVSALGIPVIQAPSEGEAQAALMVQNEDAWAVSSNDFDSLLFGAPRFIRNLSIEGRRKLPGKFAYATIKPEIVSLAGTLNHLGIDHDQLLVLGILVGTDYNPGGIKGVGPKKALKLVKEHQDFDTIFKEAKWEDHHDIDWKEIFYTFKNMPTTKDYSVAFGRVEEEKIYELLVEQHEFSSERIENQLKKLGVTKKQKEQKGLGAFF